MENNNGVSFIVPAFNCADTIQESIESIFDNNFFDGDEIIIINDASTDNTLKIVNELQIKYPIIKVISHKINKGSAAAARNTGIDYSKNELIFCLDSDNILKSNSIVNLKKYLQDQLADIAAFGEIHYFIDKPNKITHKWQFKELIGLEDALAGFIWPGPSGNYLFTKNSWIKSGRYNESIGGAYDSWAFGIKQLAANFKMITLKNSAYCHRHGYESTFIKEKNKSNSSLLALSVLISFINLIDEDDINFIFSRGNRYSWFENLEKRSIKLKNKEIGKNGLFKNSFTGYLGLNILRRVVNKIKSILK